jgi:hypothetical protein
VRREIRDGTAAAHSIVSKTKPRADDRRRDAGVCRVERESDPMILMLLLLLTGTVVFAVTCYLYRLLGQPERISARWRTSTTMESFWVFVILSGWAGGGALIVKSLTGMIWG